VGLKKLDLEIGSASGLLNNFLQKHQIKLWQKTQNLPKLNRRCHCEPDRVKQSILKTQNDKMIVISIKKTIFV